MGIIFSDRELLARLVECEAGDQGYDGMLAVAGVVMNRVNAIAGEYAKVSQGGNIRNIIYQPGQFVCASEVENGRYNPQNIFNIQPSELAYEIADSAIAGQRLPDFGQALWFYNPYSENCRNTFPSEVGYFFTVLGKHCFYNPTDLYYFT